MLEQASAPIDPQQQAVLFYLYTADLGALRDGLLAHGLPVGPIRDGSPGTEREIALSDPDGYCLMAPKRRARWCSPAAPPRPVQPGGRPEIGA